MKLPELVVSAISNHWRLLTAVAFLSQYGLQLPSSPYTETDIGQREVSIDNESDMTHYLRHIAGQFLTANQDETQAVISDDLNAKGYGLNGLSEYVVVSIMRSARILDPKVPIRNFLNFNPRSTFFPEDKFVSKDVHNLNPGDFVYVNQSGVSDFGVLITSTDEEGEVKGITLLPEYLMNHNSAKNDYVIQETTLIDSKKPTEGLLNRLQQQSSTPLSVYVWGLKPELYADFVQHKIHQYQEESVEDDKAYQLAKSASPDALPAYSSKWYWNLWRDGNINPTELRALNETYYPALPQVFVGSATRYDYPHRLFAGLNNLGVAIRDQMVRGWVLVGSGEYGYHDELRNILPAWHQNSVYGYATNPHDVLLDNQASAVYAYLAERRLGRYNQPLSVEYQQLNSRQRRIYDLTATDSTAVKRHFVPLQTHRQMGPEEALDSNTYIAPVAAKSPNDIGRRFLLFHHNEDTNQLEFDGIVLVVESLSRADWTGTGAIMGEEFKANPLIIRSQLNKERVRQQWAFDLPDYLYHSLGGEGGPLFDIIAVDADLISPPANR